MDAEKTAPDANPNRPRPEAPGPESHFIREIIEEDVRTGRNGGRVATRFPPEPNGYLHIGHAKAICIDFGMAEEFGGTCNLRYDDTNPVVEDVEYVEAIEEDIRWLGFQWAELHYASDYFEDLYRFAELLIRKGLAYVDDLSEEEIREYRGNFYQKGRPSPYRDRSPEENLDLFRRMRAGEFPDGAKVLRAKIDLESQNMNLRDPVLYRIKHAHHHRTGDSWCIYPMYDYAHPLSDALERITYSLCTLEFESHRPLYDWVIQACEAFPSRQIEFARLNLTYTVMSKRKLLQLVQGGHVQGWDDPRMPTLVGLRRRGYTPQAIRTFVERVGVAKNESVVDVALLEHTLREDLEKRAPRALAVLHPVRMVIEGGPAEGETDWVTAPNHPDDPSMGTREVPFTRTVLVERDDYREEPPKGWFRLAPGALVRLRYAAIVECLDAVKDPATGEIREIRARMVPGSRGGNHPEGKAVRGTIHWVSEAHALPAEVRLYDRLFQVENPSDLPEGQTFLDVLNPDSLQVLTGCRVEPSLARAAPEDRFQFERIGYFCADRRDHRPGGPLVFNRTVGLKDSWAKVERKARTVPEQRAAVEERPAPEAAPSTLGAASLPRPDLKPLAPEITIDDFARVDLRVGLVREAALVEGAKKLVRLAVDLGEGRCRTVFAGIRETYGDPAALVGRRVIVVANLRPREMRFGTSEGMILAAGEPATGLFLATFDGEARPGDPVG